MALKYLSPVHRVTRQIGIYFEERLPDLAGVEGHLLSYLVPYGPCTVSELVRVFGVKHSTMTSILDRLEERGLLERTANAEDRRSFLVGLTRKGKTSAAKIDKMVKELEQAIDARITKADFVAFERVIAAIGDATKVEVRRKKATSS